MLSIKSILVVIDPTVDRDFAIDRARLVAKAAAASVHLYINNANSLNQHTYLYEGIDPDFFLKQRHLFVEHHQQMLEAYAAEFAAEKIDVKTDFQEKHNLSEAIIDKAVRVKADLIIKSTHHHNLVERSLITNTDWRLIRKCPTPILLVKPNDWEIKGTIVSAVDPLHAKDVQARLDHLLLETTEFLAGLLQQEPHVFHSYFPFVSTLFASGAELNESMDRIRSEHEEKLTKLLASHHIPEANVKLSKGELVPKLIEHLITVRANILVIGALSRNILERAIVGDTAEKILEDCPCDVMVLKPKRK